MSACIKEQVDWGWGLSPDSWLFGNGIKTKDQVPHIPTKMVQWVVFGESRDEMVNLDP